MKTSRAFLVMAALGMGASGFVGCDDAEDAVSNTIDCEDVCDRYHDCVDDSFDVVQCTTDCEDNASAESAESRLEDCDNCLDERSCTEGTFQCADECAGVIDVTQ